ncbi:PAS domain-containing protein [Natrinema sp. 1APR25-10V2]|nr:PAS domain-containing protein [Natrinema sp. 1APR25-10V2]
MLIPPSAPTPTDRNPTTEMRLLLVADEQRRDRFETAFDDGPSDFVLETATALPDAGRRFDEFDCLVVSLHAIVGDGGDGKTRDTHAAVDDLLETIRSDAPDLPVVTLVDERTPDLASAVQSYEWAAIVQRDVTPDRLASRVRDLVEHRRLAVLSRRSLAGLEFAGGAVAIVDPDGELQFASRPFAMQFGADRGDLPGTPWQALFTDETVARLESAALPTVADGWQWTGGCTARRTTGESFPVRLRLGGLDDGSLVFVVESAAEREPEE